MQRLHEDDYLTEYRSLELTRDSKGVLVAEFRSNVGPFTFTAQGLSPEGASAADLVKSMQATGEPVAQKGKSA